MNDDLPKDIGGYQHVVCGPIKEGDIWVANGKVIGFVREWEFGVDLSAIDDSDGAWNLYRKMAVAQQGDCDYTGWMTKQEEMKAAGEMKRKWEHEFLDPKDVPLIKGINLHPGQKDFADAEKASTHDDGKPPLARLPFAALNEMAMVMQHGYKKYKDWNNWRKGMEVLRNASCAMRHIGDYVIGKNKDHESGCHPLAHAMVRLAFIIENEKDGKAIDDRYSAQ